MQLALTLHIPTQTAGTTDEWYLCPGLVGVWRIKAIKFAPATAVALDATNTLTSTITTNDGAAGSDTALASHHTNSTGGTALALKTTIGVSITGAGTKLTENSQIKVAKTVAGTGQILDGTYTFVVEKVN